MKCDPADGLPVVGMTSSSELGVRPGIDITVITAGDVVLDGSGMSVVPAWRCLKANRVPKRLRHLFPGAAASNNTAIFSLGTGAFQQGNVADGLHLIPDPDILPVVHGVIAPVQVVTLPQYQTDLERTRSAWKIDEV